MITKDQIPDMAICHKCGEPMRVIDLHAKGARLGVRIPEEDAFVIECCDAELTIEDENTARELRDILLAYHSCRPGRA